jgi:flagellar protein FlaI
MLDNYFIDLDVLSVKIEIVDAKDKFIPEYKVKFPKLDEGTEAIYQEIRNRLISQIQIVSHEISEKRESLKKDFSTKARIEIEKLLPGIDENTRKYLIGRLIQEMLGLGKLEILLADPSLEEVVINSSKEPIQVYHKKFGWLVTNLTLTSEEEIANYASIIGRSVRRQITNLTPLLDAHLPTGDRVNATLYPISNEGNTMTIRKFRKNPWTITEFIANGTVNAEVTALLWLAIQYEQNILISGGTGTGKTSFLTTLMPFIPPNQRIISIEDTREVKLPDFLHWVPMVTREPNQEGKGEVSMLDLLVNSLRMRPDRIILGEIRRSREAEVLFEAMHTGHSVYGTIHADTAMQTYKRLVTPPIAIPETLMGAIDLFVVMFRDRRKGIRRVYEVAEIPYSTIKNIEKINVVYKWDPSSDKIYKNRESKKARAKLRMMTGMEEIKIEKEIKNREKVLTYMVKKNINDVNSVGKFISSYMKNPQEILNKIK